MHNAPATLSPLLQGESLGGGGSYRREHNLHLVRSQRAGWLASGSPPDCLKINCEYNLLAKNPVREFQPKSPLIVYKPTQFCPQSEIWEACKDDYYPASYHIIRELWPQVQKKLSKSKHLAFHFQTTNVNIQQAFRLGYEFDSLMVAHEFENVSVSFS